MRVRNEHCTHARRRPVACAHPAAPAQAARRVQLWPVMALQEACNARIPLLQCPCFMEHVCKAASALLTGQLSASTRGGGGLCCPTNWVAHSDAITRATLTCSCSVSHAVLVTLQTAHCTASESSACSLGLSHSLHNNYNFICHRLHHSKPSKKAHNQVAVLSNPESCDQCIY